MSGQVVLEVPEAATLGQAEGFPELAEPRLYQSALEEIFEEAEINGLILPTLTVLATTGNRGTPVTAGLTPLNLSLSVANVPAGTQIMLNVTYGHWNSPDVPVTVKLNNTVVGNFVANNAFISTGPRTDQFDVTGLVIVGSNTVNFLGSSSGDYVISQLDLIVPVPEPATVWLLAGGLCMLFWQLRRRRAPIA